MFTIFLVSLAIASSAVMGGLLLRPNQDVQESRVPYAAISVAAIAIGLVAIGLWMA